MRRVAHLRVYEETARGWVETGSNVGGVVVVINTHRVRVERKYIENAGVCGVLIPGWAMVKVQWRW